MLHRVAVTKPDQLTEADDAAVVIGTAISVRFFLEKLHVFFAGIGLRCNYGIGPLRMVLIPSCRRVKPGYRRGKKRRYWRQALLLTCVSFHWAQGCSRLCVTLCSVSAL